MEYEQALIIGKRRRADAAMALGGYVREKVTEVCAVKPAKGAGLDAKDWEPVGEKNYKEICIRRGLIGDEEAYLLIVDETGSAKACTQKIYPLSIAMQMAWRLPLPTYVGEGGTLLAQATDAAMQKAQRVAAEQEV